MIGRSLTLTLSFCAVLGVTACDNSTARPPVLPTPVLPSVTALAINGLPSSLTVGTSVQLVASVTLPDGTTKLVAGVTWSFSDATVATVSSGGLLTVTGVGEGDATAMFQNARERHTTWRSFHETNTRILGSRQCFKRLS